MTPIARLLTLRHYVVFTENTVQVRALSDLRLKQARQMDCREKTDSPSPWCPDRGITACSALGSQKLDSS